LVKGREEQKETNLRIRDRNKPKPSRGRKGAKKKQQVQQHKQWRGEGLPAGEKSRGTRDHRSNPAERAGLPQLRWGTKR